MKAADDPSIGEEQGHPAPASRATPAEPSVVPAAKPGAVQRAFALLGWLLLAALWGLHFHVDVGARDAFSWMDPYQYYLFARGVADGSLAFDESAVPSIFPFFVVPLLRGEGGIPAALRVNAAFAAVLAVAIAAIVRRARIAVPSVVVAAVVLASPLLLGLSRTLYVELALTALVALGFAALLRWVDTGRGRDLVAFALLLAVGLMVKMTFPAFFLVPLAGIAWCAFRRRRGREVLRLAVASIGAVGGVLLLQYAVFPASFRYYTSFGNTAIPVMRLIGPPEVLSAASFGYYPRVLVTLALALLSPLVVLALLPRREGRRSAGAARAVASIPAPSTRVLLWLWLLGPVLLLTFQPVKEPRHVAPCVVPAVLLVFDGIAAVRGTLLRRALTAAALVVAATQYVAVASGAVTIPYYLRGTASHDRLEAAMLRMDRDGLDQDVPPELRWSAWKFRQNVVIAGFEANEALALTWSLFPAVVYDLAQFESDAPDTELAFEHFEDLYLLTAFNTYNRRAGWDAPYATLGEKVVLANADWALVGPELEDYERFGELGLELVALTPTAGGVVSVFRATRATEPYRALYARRFLRRNPDLDTEERTAVGYELLLTTLLERDLAALPDVLRSFPELAEPERRRRIYWITAYQPLHAFAIAWMAEHAPVRDD